MKRSNYQIIYTYTVDVQNTGQLSRTEPDTTADGGAPEKEGFE